MSIKNKLTPESMKYHMRGGDAEVFGPDSAARRKLDQQEEIERRFAEVWDRKISPSIKTGEVIGREAALAMLVGKQKNLAWENCSYWQFSVSSVPFIALIRTEGSDEVCRQLWSLGLHRDNSRLIVYFDTEQARERFGAISKRLLYPDPASLALELLTDFMDKFDSIES